MFSEDLNDLLIWKYLHFFSQFFISCHFYLFFFTNDLQQVIIWSMLKYPAHFKKQQIRVEYLKMKERDEYEMTNN